MSDASHSGDKCETCGGVGAVQVRVSTDDDSGTEPCPSCEEREGEFSAQFVAAIARRCCVAPGTIKRWVSGESAPHPLGRESVLKALQSATRAPWTPCSKRMPTEHGLYLTFDKFGEIELWLWEGGWCYLMAGHDPALHELHITHWMPAPKAPLPEDGKPL
jgi:hypothetical protein